MGHHGSHVAADKGDEGEKCRYFLHRMWLE
jgi:hypothetical protein